MNSVQKISLFSLRVTLGWMCFYAGITKVLDPAWSAAGYMQSAKLFPGFFQWLAGPSMLPFVNVMNMWGLTLIGLALILGVATRLASKLGVLLMILYYLPLGFPMPNEHAYLVDEHVIYAVSFFILVSFNTGDFWSLGSSLAARFPKLKNLLA